ncbi:MAG: CPBP family intramembrane metalloprotease [Hamadaea sp.]|uniref:CPBP family intramembrane glutamic endopeptidase n=1 Tax=Hamadaea sp. TaxID=2024425 RepID=UPI0017B0EB0A|nr:CPBP family intramembrane glutamic endopeptidase [Hamadaea sp.]NUR69525.1 CPBP family intramembrane metalloprotease [Hamadaea sp.]NUT20761.1 CPBP family intramembrane metalloprotease [Hamadaea sp.]
MSRWLLRRPLAGAVILTLLWHAVVFAADAALPPLSPDWFPALGPTLINLLAAVVPIGVAVISGWWGAAGFGWRVPRRAWWYALPVLVACGAYAVSPLAGDAAALTSTAVMCLAIGVSEESLSRGVNQMMLARLGRFRAAVWVAVLFGLGHALSAAWFGRDLDDTVMQVISTTAFGFCFAALRFHLGVIWPLVLLHALDDFLQLTSPGKTPDWLQVAEIVFFVGYGWWLLTRLPRSGLSLKVPRTD